MEAFVKFLKFLIIGFLIFDGLKAKSQVWLNHAMDMQNAHIKFSGADCQVGFQTKDSISENTVVLPYQGDGFLKLTYLDTIFLPECIIQTGKKFSIQNVDGLTLHFWSVLLCSYEEPQELQVDINLFYRDTLVSGVKNLVSLLSQDPVSEINWEKRSIISNSGRLNPSLKQADSVELIYRFSGFEAKKPFVFYLDDVQLELFRIAGVEEARINNLNVYPNPCSDRLNIHSETIWSKAALYDLNGRLLKSFEPDDALPDGGLDVSELPAGIFVLQLQLPDGSQARARVVKGR